MTAGDSFGIGLAFDKGDLVVRDRELATVQGLDNLIQSLRLKVSTPFGSDYFNTQYGLDLTAAFTQPATLKMVRDLIQSSLIRTLASDPRVRAVSEVQFEDVHPSLRTARVRVVIVPVDGPAQTLVFPLPIGA